MVHIHVAIRELDCVSSGEVIGSPTLHANPRASNPVSHEKAAVGVATLITAGCINKAGIKGRRIEMWSLLSLDAFHTKFQVRHLWQLGKVESCSQGAACREDGRHLINHQRVQVGCHPLSQAWNAVAEVKG